MHGQFTTETKKHIENVSSHTQLKPSKFNHIVHETKKNGKNTHIHTHTHTKQSTHIHSL
jgi:hypothetical protein